MNKKFLLIVLNLLLWVRPTYALDIYLGSISHHLIVHNDAESSFRGRIANGGRTIVNGLLGVGDTRYQGEKYTNLRFFLGQNSIHKFMAGVAFGSGYVSQYIDYGVIGGAYGQNNRFYRDRDLKNFAIELGSLGVIPILGIEATFKYQLTQRMSVGLSNIVTPALTNHSIRIQYQMDN